MEPITFEDSAVRLAVPPYETFHWLHDANLRRSRCHLGACEAGVGEWWAGLQQSKAGQLFWGLDPWLQGRTADDLRWHQPLMLFEDSGPLSNNGSAMDSVLGVVVPEAPQVAIDCAPAATMNSESCGTLSAS